MAVPGRATQRGPDAPSLDVVVAAVTHRLVPFLLLVPVLSFLDLANIGSATSAFQADTGDLSR